MTCEHVNLGGGVHALIRRPAERARKCSVCKVSTKEPRLCDFPIGGGKSCDKVLCRACARPAPTSKSAPDVYETLEIIAREKKVSLAWVVREAAEKYIGDKWPLFNPKAGER
jgi:hypothetical protein